MYNNLCRVCYGNVIQRTIYHGMILIQKFMLVYFILMRVSCFQWKNILFIFMKTESLDKHTNTTTQPVHGTTNDKLKICVQLSAVRTHTSICTRKTFSKYLFNKYENHFGRSTRKFYILYYSRFL